MFTVNFSQVKFLGEHKAKLLSLSTFVADANNLSKHFQGCLQETDFIAKWKSHVQPYLNVKTGEIAVGGSSIQTHEAVLPDISSSSANKQKNDSSIILPATKLARKQLSTTDSQDETQMDEEIQKHFLGMVTT